MTKTDIQTGINTASLGVKLYIGTSFAVVLLMMLAGVLMRMAQAEWLTLGPDFFYQLMTVHGAGMVGISGLAGAGIMWHFLSKYVSLSHTLLLINYALFMLGVALMLGAIFIGGYAGGWTFLWPLPAKGMGLWGPHGAASFVVGLILIGTGFLLFYLDAAIAITQRYGSIFRGLGLDQLWTGRIDESHPPTVVASCMVIIVNTIGTLTGAVILVITLINLYLPDFGINALLAKNMIYFFGHVFINASIYMSVIAVYELLPKYTGRPWKVSRPFFAAWAAATVFVMAVYPHHLLLDSVMPKSLLVLGQIISYLSGIPVLLVTLWGALLQIYRSGLRWSLPAMWLILAMFGWSAGVIPAIVDGTLVVNQVMHNTLWVPGHFHMYLLLGLLPMVIGFSLDVFKNQTSYNAMIQRSVFTIFVAGGLVFCVAFLLAGWSSVPRRWATHWPEWLIYDHIGSVGSVAVLVGMLVLTLSVIKRITTRA